MDKFILNSLTEKPWFMLHGGYAVLVEEEGEYRCSNNKNLIKDLINVMHETTDLKNLLDEIYKLIDANEEYKESFITKKLNK